MVVQLNRRLIYRTSICSNIPHDIDCKYLHVNCICIGLIEIFVL